MASLAQLLASHRRILVLDAASSRVQVGLLDSNRPARWQGVTEEAGKGLFVAISALTGQSGLGIDDIPAFAFCEGPGSMLGLRIVAMALRTWTTLKARPVYTYQSLALAARHAWKVRPRAFMVIADARRDSWHTQAIQADGLLGPLQRVPAADLPAGELLTPDNFRAWAEPPRPAASCTYDLATLFSATAEDNLFRETGAPEVFQHDAPDYKKWSAQPHSAETAPRR